MSVIVDVIMVLSEHQFLGSMLEVRGAGSDSAGIVLTPEASAYLAHLAEIGVERAVEVLAFLGA